MASEQLDPSQLMAFIHNELGPEDTRKIAQLIKENPYLQLEIEGLKKTSAMLEQYYKAQSTTANQTHISTQGNSSFELNPSQIKTIRSKARHKSTPWFSILSITGSLAAATIAGVILWPMIGDNFNSFILNNEPTSGKERNTFAEAEEGALRPADRVGAAPKKIVTQPAPAPPNQAAVQNSPAESENFQSPDLKAGGTSNNGLGGSSGTEITAQSTDNAPTQIVSAPTGRKEIRLRQSVAAKTKILEMKKGQGVAGLEKKSFVAKPMDVAAKDESGHYNDLNLEAESDAAAPTVSRNKSAKKASPSKNLIEKQIQIIKEKSEVPTALNQSLILNWFTRSVDRISVCTKILNVDSPSSMRAIIQLSAQSNIESLNIQPRFTKSDEFAECLKMKLRLNSLSYQTPNNEPYKAVIFLKLQ